MCGLGGLLSLDESDVDERMLDQMIDSLRHRGPDASGKWHEPSIALGHTRLSIQDLSSAASQPMVSSNGRFVISYNGEVYNSPELRKQLEDLGQQFRSTSDTEVILEAFARWGTASFEKLNGMFAMALWDRRERNLILARDRFGIKPLYWTRKSELVAFGSEIKAVLHAAPSHEMSWESLHEYLHFGVALGGKTMFRDIEQVRPGSFVEISQRYTSFEVFANIRDVPTISDDYRTAKERVGELLEEAVRSHLLSDVPIGVFLSGGIDSACITAYASRHYDGQISTYSSAFDFDAGESELENAALVAKRFGTDHHELLIKAVNVSDDLERLVECHDVPFADIANLPLYLLCKELNGTPKVILQGDGGDELFAGYHRYSRLARIKTFQAIAPWVLSLQTLIPKNSTAHRSLRTFYALAKCASEDRMAWIMSQEPFGISPLQILSTEAQARLANTEPFSRYRELCQELKHHDAVKMMQLTDCSIILPDKYFEKVDRSTMAHSIEVRVPFLDVNLAEYALGMPTQYKVKGSRKKRILRDVLRGLVPDQILDGRKKGFGVPISEWLRKPLAEYLRSVLLDDATLSLGLFNAQEIQRRIDAHVSGKADFGMILYKLLVLSIWLRTYRPTVANCSSSLRRVI